MKPVALDPTAHPAMRKALLAHYDRHARDLPWRRDADPYRVLVSEVMLQQTRVETVTPYYERWLERFPSLEALASADSDEVLKAWEGLGYYRRARNLHGSARVVHEEHGGELPSDTAGLRALPGVGEYTAGAVASIAFGQRVAAVDGNVRRVLARLFDRAEPRASWLRETATDLVDPERPGDWNQALMELGATVCAPRSPECDRCPLESWCGARAAGTQLERPRPKAREAPRSTSLVVIVPHRGDRVLVQRRPEGGLLGGMWAFPERALDGAKDPEARDEEAHARTLASDLGLLAADAVPLPPCRHRFTHLDAVYLPWALSVSGDVDPSVGAEVDWIAPHETDDRALPVAQRKILNSWIDAMEAGAP